jgi:hypothetical protein
MMKSNFTSERGIALVLTLAILVIATILVVGFVSSMRTERQAASSMANNAAAGLITQAAIDHAVSVLDWNIPQPISPGGTITNPVNWIISPGLLATIQGTNTPIQIPLSSNPSPTYSSNSQDAELNVPLLSNSGYAILPGTGAMRVAWIPILKDPTTAAGVSNQIFGRYGFWIDDENSKININTAYGKPSNNAGYYSDSGNSNANIDSYRFGVPSFPIPLVAVGSSITPTFDNPYSLGHPISISLDVLSGVNRDSMWTDRLQRQFGSPSEVSRYGVNYQQNKFWLTSFNRDPEFNVFGKSRIFMTDSTFQPSDAGTNPPVTGTLGAVGFAFAPESSSTVASLRDADELLTFHSDGTSTSVNPTKNPTEAAVTEIAKYLGTRWPGYSHTFVEKWSTIPGTADDQGLREAQQVAWNIFGMATSAANETNNGKWGNQTPAAAQPAPTPTRFAALLWDGPKPDATWPTSKILPQTRSPYVNRFAISFIATQFTRPNSGTLVTGLKGTTKYVVNVRLAPQVCLPLGYQGIQQFTAAGAPQPWKVSNDEIYITHLEATVDDGSGSGPATVKWVSETQTDNGALYWDSNGGTKLYKFGGNSGSGILSPDSRSYNFAATSTAWDFSSKDNTVGVSPSRTISLIFDSGSTSRPCNISNVKIRFIVTTGSGSFITPYQISPIRDVDGANGFEASNAQNGSIKDAGSVILPSFQIPTASISSATPDYWMTVETLDPRVNQRGSTVVGSTSGDDWQATSSTPSLIAPVSPTRSTRLATNYPAAGPAGDESKLAWLDASPYIGSGASKTRWGSNPSHLNNRMPTIGLLSCLSTGIQSGSSWRTLRFQSTPDDPPDWLLLDLFAVPFNRVTFVTNQKYVPASPPPLTYMNSTAGKININTVISPSDFNLLPGARDVPLKALLHNMYRPQVGNSVPPQPDETVLFDNIATYLNGKASHVFDYAGEICQVPGIADASAGSYEWEREALVRDLASLITTRSNSFGVWGVAQTVKKNPANSSAGNQGIFETKSGGAVADDIITGEKRFHAIVERYVWPGVDDIAGNAQTVGGNYSQLGTVAWLGSITNSIDASDPSQPTFSTAYNPGAATMKYRVVYFEYLN